MAYGAFEPLGIYPLGVQNLSTLQLRFHWMLLPDPEALIIPWLQCLNLVDKGRALIHDWKMRKAECNDPKPTKGQALAAINVVTSQHLRTGHIFDITMETGDMNKLEEMITHTPGTFTGPA